MMAKGVTRHLEAVPTGVENHEAYTLHYGLANQAEGYLKVEVMADGKVKGTFEFQTASATEADDALECMTEWGCEIVPRFELKKEN